MKIKNAPATLTGVFTWNTDYAVYVHEGVEFTRDVSFPTKDGSWVRIKAGTVYPPRRWTEYATKNFDFNTVFGRIFAQTGDAEKAFKDTCFLLGRQFTQAITSTHWQWPDGGSRDIVDTGTLRASQRLEFE